MESVLALILVIIGSAFSYSIYNKSKFNANLFFDQKTKKFPSLSESIIPIIVPVILIAIGTLFGNLNTFKNLDFVFSFLSNPSFALVVGVILSFRLIKFNPEIGLNFCIKNGLYSALPIVLITGMGGTLGLIMQKIP